jgi:hypothetical protein
MLATGTFALDNGRFADQSRLYRCFPCLLCRYCTHVISPPARQKILAGLPLPDLEQTWQTRHNNLRFESFCPGL